MQLYDRGLTPDVVTYNTIIGAYCKASDMANAERFVSKMLAEGIEPDIFTYNILIHGLCSNYMMNRAMEMVDGLLSMGFAPNTVTYNTMMNGTCNDVLDRAMILTGKLLKMIFLTNVVTINLLLSHFCKQHMYKKALIWGEKLSQLPFNFDDATWNILKQAYDNPQEDAVSSKTEHSGSLFLEFLMYSTYEYLLRNKPAEHKQLMIPDIIDHGISLSSKMMDVR